MDTEQVKRIDTIFWIEVSSIKPNSQQPRKEFDETKLKELASSIKQYGILQPLLVSRVERDIETGTVVEYELISGERRWRASQIAGLNQVPVIIRKEPPERVKLELALIENIQRTNLNAIEKARAFKQLAEEFDMRHHEIGIKIGKSREYVSNTIRLLNLPEEMMIAVAEGKITEGHGRSLLRLCENTDAQKTLFQDIINKNVPSGEAEKISRRIAYSKMRKQRGLPYDEEMRELENRFTNLLGARVMIDRKGDIGQISITFFSEDQLKTIFSLMSAAKEKAIFQRDEPKISGGSQIQINEIINETEEKPRVELVSEKNFSDLNPHNLNAPKEEIKEESNYAEPEKDENISVFEINDEQNGQKENYDNDIESFTI